MERQTACSPALAPEGIEVRSRTICGSALAGATAFWATNLAISLTPAAADYRAALSISYVPMLVEAAIGGIVIGLLVNRTLARVPERVPGRKPLTKALVLGLGVLIMVTVLVELPAKLLASVEAPVHYLVVATAFN